MWTYDDDDKPKSKGPVVTNVRETPRAPATSIGEWAYNTGKDIYEGNGTGPTFQEAYERATSAAGTGETGALIRGLEDLFNLDDRMQQAELGGDAEEREAYRDSEQVKKVRQVRETWAEMDKLNPAWRENGAFAENVARLTGSFLGDMAGNANVSYLAGFGKNAAQRIAAQGGINAGIDGALQANEINEDIQDEYDPKRTAIQLLAGMALQGGGEIVAKGLGRGENLGMERQELDEANDAGQQIKDRWAEFWKANEEHKAQTGENAPNFETIAKEFEDLYKTNLPDEDFNPNWDPTQEDIVVEGERSVSSDYGADAQFNDADEAFTNALVTGRATPEIEAIVKGMEAENAPRNIEEEVVGELGERLEARTAELEELDAQSAAPMVEPEAPVPENVVPLNRENPTVQGASDALVQLRKMSNDMHLDAEVEGGKYPLGQLVAIHKKITEKLDEGAFKGADLEEANNIKAFLDEAIVWRDQTDNGMSVPDGAIFVNPNRGAGDIQLAPANDVEGNQLFPTEREAAALGDNPSGADLEAVRGARVNPETGEVEILPSRRQAEPIFNNETGGYEYPSVSETVRPASGGKGKELPKPPSEPPRGGGGDEPPKDPRPAKERLIEALEGAKKLTAQQKKLYSEERKSRLRDAYQAARKASGEGGHRARMSALKGEMPKVDFEGVRNQFSKEDVEELFDEIANTDKLTGYEPVNAGEALKGLLEGKLPTPSQLSSLAKVFGPEVVKTLVKHRTTSAKALDAAINALNLPRSLMATADLSAPFRQGIFMVGRKEFWNNWGTMFKAFGTEDAFKGIQDEIKSRNTYPVMEDSNLAILDMDNDLTKREEDFISQWAEKIPLVRRSGRAYTAFLNKLRADSFDNIYRKYQDMGVDISTTDLARYINSATGRGDLGKLNSSAPLLNATFFSPRLIKSRVDLLNPLFYATLDRPVQKEAVKDLLKFGGIALTVLGLAKMGGAEVQDDPRSTDFGKIKVGNTRYDVLGGFGQYITLGARLLTDKKLTNAGKEVELSGSDEYKADSRADVLSRFGRNKLAPIPAYVVNYLDGENVIGEEFEADKDAAKLAVPLMWQQMYETMEEEGYLKGAAMSVPGVFGVGVSTYGDKPPKEKEESESSSDSYEYEEDGVEEAPSNQWTYED